MKTLVNLAAATALARGQKRKVLLPLAGTPAEFALVRRGDEVVRRFYRPHRLAERLRTRTNLRAPRVVLR